MDNQLVPFTGRVNKPRRYQGTTPRQPLSRKGPPKPMSRGDNAYPKPMSRSDNAYPKPVIGGENASPNLITRGENGLPRLVSKNEIYRCYLCEKFTSSTPDGICAHVKKDHLNLEDGFLCVYQGCNFRASIMAEVSQHFTKTHRKQQLVGDPRTTCLLCGVRRSNSQEVQRHLNIVHLMNNEYVCTACSGNRSYATFSLKEWVDHVQQNHPKNSPKLKVNREENYTKLNNAIDYTPDVVSIEASPTKSTSTSATTSDTRSKTGIIPSEEEVKNDLSNEVVIFDEQKKSSFNPKNYTCDAPSCTYTTTILNCIRRHVNIKHNKAANYSTNSPKKTVQTVPAKPEHKSVERASKPIDILSSRNEKSDNPIEIEKPSAQAQNRLLGKDEDKPKLFTLVQYNAQNKRQRAPDYKCNLCPSRYLTEIGVLKHIQKEHEEPKTIKNSADPEKIVEESNQGYYYLCLMCNSKKVDEQLLMEHIDKTHFMQYKGQCMHCPYTGMDPTELMIHGEAKHYSEFALSHLVCIVCNYRMKNVEDAKMHVKDKHSGENKDRRTDMAKSSGQGFKFPDTIDNPQGPRKTDKPKVTTNRRPVPMQRKPLLNTEAKVQNVMKTPIEHNIQKSDVTSTDKSSTDSLLDIPEEKITKIDAQHDAKNQTNQKEYGANLNSLGTNELNGTEFGSSESSKDQKVADTVETDKPKITYEKSDLLKKSTLASRFKRSVASRRNRNSPIVPATERKVDTSTVIEPQPTIQEVSPIDKGQNISQDEIVEHISKENDSHPITVDPLLLEEATITVDASDSTEKSYMTTEDSIQKELPNTETGVAMELEHSILDKDDDDSMSNCDISQADATNKDKTFTDNGNDSVSSKNETASPVKTTFKNTALSRRIRGSIVANRRSTLSKTGYTKGDTKKEQHKPANINNEMPNVDSTVVTNKPETVIDENKAFDPEESISPASNSDTDSINQETPNDQSEINDNAVDVGESEVIPLPAEDVLMSKEQSHQNGDSSLFHIDASSNEIGTQLVQADELNYPSPNTDTNSSPEKNYEDDISADLALSEHVTDGEDVSSQELVAGNVEPDSNKVEATPRDNENPTFLPQEPANIKDGGEVKIAIKGFASIASSDSIQSTENIAAQDSDDKKGTDHIEMADADSKHSLENSDSNTNEQSSPTIQMKVSEPVIQYEKSSMLRNFSRFRRAPLGNRRQNRNSAITAKPTAEKNPSTETSKTK